MNALYAPVIVMGMHRSGTSLLVDVLEALGIHMGVVQDHHGEAMHFLSINQRALLAAGGNWLHPVVPAEPHFDTWSPLDLYLEHLKQVGKWAKIKALIHAQPWGWKDPRNTFTLHHWLRIFPQAKVIHVHRHPAEVIASLQVRNEKQGEVQDEALQDPAFCFRLWEQYVEQAMSYQGVHHIAYQGLLQASPEVVGVLQSVTGKDPRPALERLCGPVKPTPGMELPPSPWMQQLGYL